MKLQNYTLKYLTLTLLLVIPLWAGLFYALMLEEVYDNIDDGLKNSKILIVRGAYADKKVLNTRDFGINQFKITPLPKGNYDYSDRFISTFEFSEYDGEDQPVRLLETVFNDPAGNPHKLTIRASMVEEDELMEDLLLALAGLYVMLVISLIILNRLILKRIWKSFYNTLSTLKRYKLGTGTRFTPSKTSIDEFRTLDKEVADMLQRNEEIYMSQKQFIENAAHELQTPLAISLNKLDLFAESNNLPEEQMMELSKISDTLHRLVRLNKSLLMLSKIENRQYADEEVVNFNELVYQLEEDYRDMAEFRNITLTIEAQGQLNFTMNRGLAVALVSNLLKNAISHNYTGGSITVKTGHNTIIVSNTGEDAALDSNAIFRRFTRSLKNEGSTGLGLSIVKSIADSYNISISYTFDSTHNFILKFPG